MVTQVSDYRYDIEIDIEIKGQGQIYLNSVLRIVTQIHVSFLDNGIHIWLNDCLWQVDDNIESKVKVNCTSNLCFGL